MQRLQLLRCHLSHLVRRIFLLHLLVELARFQRLVGGLIQVGQHKLRRRLADRDGWLFDQALVDVDRLLGLAGLLVGLTEDGVREGVIGPRGDGLLTPAA